MDFHIVLTSMMLNLFNANAKIIIIMIIKNNNFNKDDKCNI